VLDRGHRLVAEAEVPLSVVQHFEQACRSARVGALVDQGERGPGERLLARAVAFQPVVLSGAAEERHPVGAG
jgi:hypothetical protein